MSLAQRMWARSAVLLSLVCGAAWSAPAEPLAEVQELVKAGRSGEALRTLDTLIAQRPADAQLRFQKGVILVDQKRGAEAITVFQRLGQDFPALPEPFNNLAVLYVEQGQLDKARAALESAIRSRPNYSTAFQNLGDVYTRMAGRAYAKALQIEDPEAAPKLALIRDIYDLPAPPVATVAALTPVAPAAASKAPPAPASAAPPAPAPVPAPAASAVVAAATPAPAASSANGVRSNDDTRAVTAAVRDWASAWSRKDMNAYIGAYVSGYKGSDASASAWQANRRERILGKRRISVEVAAIKVDVSKDSATVSFRQAYAADLLRVSSQKVLELEHHNGKWLIRKESTGS
jgi:tetratricopeptide (TPR) repeat protein